jgi:hypothetical protein
MEQQKTLSVVVKKYRVGLRIDGKKGYKRFKTLKDAYKYSKNWRIWVTPLGYRSAKLMEAGRRTQSISGGRLSSSAN